MKGIIGRNEMVTLKATRKKELFTGKVPEEKR
jgi:hypothetical protein